MSYPQQPYGQQPQYGQNPYAQQYAQQYGGGPYGPPHPQQQPFLTPYPLADTGARVVQGLIDLLIQLIPLFVGLVLIIVLTTVSYVTETSSLIGFVVLLYIAVGLASWGISFYNHVWRPAKRGTDQTIGMEKRNLRVVRLDGAPVTMGDHAVRWLLFVLVEGGLVALILIAATQRRQRLGDLAAKTVVVQLPSH